MKKGVSATIIGIILLVVGLAVILTLVLYFGLIGGEQTMAITDSVNLIRGGAGII